MLLKINKKKMNWEQETNPKDSFVFLTKTDLFLSQSLLKQTLFPTLNLSLSLNHSLTLAYLSLSNARSLKPSHLLHNTCKKSMALKRFKQTKLTFGGGSVEKGCFFHYSSLSSSRFFAVSKDWFFVLKFRVCVAAYFVLPSNLLYSAN